MRIALLRGTVSIVVGAAALTQRGDFVGSVTTSVPYARATATASR